MLDSKWTVSKRNAQIDVADVCYISHILLLCQNLVPTLHTMELYLTIEIQLCYASSR